MMYSNVVLITVDVPQFVSCTCDDVLREWYQNVLQRYVYHQSLMMANEHLLPFFTRSLYVNEYTAFNIISPTHDTV